MPEKTGVLIDLARVVSVGRARPTGQVVLRFRDEKGRLVAVRLRPRQFRTRANGDGRVRAARQFPTAKSCVYDGTHY